MLIILPHEKEYTLEEQKTLEEFSRNFSDFFTITISTSFNDNIYYINDFDLDEKLSETLSVRANSKQKQINHYLNPFCKKIEVLGEFKNPTTGIELEIFDSCNHLICHYIYKLTVKGEFKLGTFYKYDYNDWKFFPFT